MKTPNSAGASAKSESDTCRPCVSGSEKSGATTPSGNIVLAVFNLIPIPPLDGSHVVGALLPPRLHWQWVQLERYGFLLLFALLWTGFLGIILRPFVTGLLWILLS